MSLSPVRQVNPNAAGTERRGRGNRVATCETRQAPKQLEVLKQVLFILKAIEKQQLQLNFVQVFEKYF